MSSHFKYSTGNILLTRYGLGGPVVACLRLWNFLMLLMRVVMSQLTNRYVALRKLALC
jgi:hypothetical protein